MLIVRVMGGLGNQLQQYALYRKLEYLGRNARLDVSWFHGEALQADGVTGRELELARLQLPRWRTASESEIRAVLGRLWEEPERMADKVKRKLGVSAGRFFEETDMYHPEIFGMDDCCLVGYWACEKYYADILDTLRAEITFPRSGNAQLRRRNEETMREMEEGESVSLHIRRGDYLDEANRGLFGGICTDTYYERALAYVRERFPRARFFVFSDDTAYARERFRGAEYRIVDWNKGSDSFYDMMLMSRCKHNICANSTFSFWGARLNPHRDKIMIRPSIHKNTQVCVPEVMRDLWQGWLLITPQGEVV